LANSDSMLYVDSISKRYNSVQALNRASLTFEAGIAGLIGPNGAGKTTLLKVLLGLALPDSGSARVLGQDIARDSLSIRKEVGVLHEHPFFPKALSGRQYLELVTHFYRTHANPQDMLSMVGLSDVTDRPLGQLSAGMLQRFGLAHALIGQPKLVFLDEPTSNLDVQGKDDVMRLIMDLNSDEGVSFLISSHTLPELQRLCHYVAFIRNGEVILSGDVRSVISQYTATRYQVVTSNSKSLASKMEDISGIRVIKITGVNTVTFKAQQADIEQIQKRIEAVAKESEIIVYAFTNADTLEDVYMELMSDA
jgi:ABC-2 type transport system ATP-binding protein